MKSTKGFTLVELLIVIALLGILATAVLAAINPLEQANRARDTRMRSDASQLLAAIDRYFVAQSEFPWQTVDPTTYDSSDDAVNFSSAKLAVIGLCSSGGSGCNVDGVLISNNELKTEFRKRDFIKATDTEWSKLLYVGKEAGASSSVYACFVPLSKSERTKADTTISLSGAVITSGVTGCASRTYSDLANSCVVCLPQ
jgi:prepilin-type N-terminal cleavage/methylation domain-containing protein